MSGGFGDRKPSSSGYDPRGTATQKMAVESLKNIASFTVGERSSPPDDDPDVDAISTLLKDAHSPVAIAEVAERLGWDSGHAADALARGGDRGRLTFLRTGGRTFVGLPAVPGDKPAA